MWEKLLRRRFLHSRIQARWDAALCLHTGSYQVYGSLYLAPPGSYLVA